MNFNTLRCIVKSSCSLHLFAMVCRRSRITSGFLSNFVIEWESNEHTFSVSLSRICSLFPPVFDHLFLLSSRKYKPPGVCWWWKAICISYRLSKYLWASLMLLTIWTQFNFVCWTERQKIWWNPRCKYNYKRWAHTHTQRERNGNMHKCLYVYRENHELRNYMGEKQHKN